MAKKTTTKTKSTAPGKKPEARLAKDSSEAAFTDELHNLSVAYHELDLKLRVLDRMLKLFHAPKRVKTNLDSILGISIELANCETGSIFLVDQDAKDLFFATVHGPKAADLQDMHIDFGQGIVGTCAQDQKTIAVSDVQKDPRFCKEISDRIGYETHSILATPIMYKGNVLGVIELINKKGSDIYSHFDIALIERIAEITGTLLIIASQLKKQS